MIFKIIPTNDELLEKIYRESMDDLNSFYEINWINNTPIITVVDDRKTINLLKKKETENWIVGWANGNTVYILNRNNLEKESNHKYDPEKYYSLVKHEFSHLFYNILSGGTYKPIWLNEGVATYTSGQNKFKKKPDEFKKFLEFYEQGGSDVYTESGFFVQTLVEKFGKQRLLNLIKELKNIKTKEEFERFFAKEYGFNLTYDEINSFIKRVVQ